LLKFGSMDAQTVAEDGYRATMAGKPVVISGVKNWLLAEMTRFAPRRLATALVRKVQQRQ
jgi:short-subunit dehydrogenase